MRAFFDSNVIVYALAGTDDLRRERALALLEQHAADNTLVLSTQVLMESYNVLTRKKGASAAVPLAALRLLCRHEVVAPSAKATLAAQELAGQHRLSHSDALIVQAEVDADCEVLWSEDMQTGWHFGDLQVLNPFTLTVHEAGLKLDVKRGVRKRPMAT